VPDTVADQRTERVRTEAKDRKNSQLQPETLALCQWTILITNLDADQATAHEIQCLLRLRWQIELLFKLWKDELSLDDWRSQHPHRILTEVYAKLLLALFQHWLLVASCWDTPNRSLVKASRLLRKHAFHILTAYLISNPSVVVSIPFFPLLTVVVSKNEKRDLLLFSFWLALFLNLMPMK
jgi:IS4 transposase